MDEPFTLIGVDPLNAETHSLIGVRGDMYSVYEGYEQQTANEIATNKAER